MLPRDDILRELPVILPQLDRLRLETLVFALDLMESALSRLYELAPILEPHNSSDFRSALFGAAWTIVDQTHIARGLLQDLTRGSASPQTLSYISDYEVATKMRNIFNHPRALLPNRAKSQKLSEPFFGIISFFIPNQESFERAVIKGVVRGHLHQISSGAIQGGLTVAALFPSVMKLPICDLKLSAHGMMLDLEGSVVRMRMIMESISHQVRRQINDAVQEGELRTGRSWAHLLDSSRFDMHLVFDIGVVVEEINTIDTTSLVGPSGT